MRKVFCPCALRGRETTTADVLIAPVEPYEAAVEPGPMMLMVTMVGWPRPMVVENAAMAQQPIYSPALSHSAMFDVASGMNR